MPVYEYKGQFYELSETDPTAAKNKILAHLGQPGPKERTFGEAAKDIAASVVSGAGSLVQLPGQLYGLATGNFADTGALGLGKDIRQYGEEMKSAGLKAREQERAQKIQTAEQKGQWEAFKTAFGETIKDPALLTSFLAEQAPQLLVPFGAARVAQIGTAAKATAAAQGLTGTAAKEAVEAVTKAAAERGTKAAIGAGAVQQGADVGSQAYEDIYKELIRKGATEPDAAQGAINLARAAGASGSIISLLAQRLPGARTLEESFAGVKGTSGRVVGALKGAAGEGASEIAEETGGKFGANLAMREVKPEQSLLEGLGQTAGMAAVGGVGLGGVAGALRTPGDRIEIINGKKFINGKPVEEEAPPVAPPAAEVPLVEEVPAAPTSVTPEFLTELGIKPTAAVARRIKGKSLDDPAVATELETYANKYASEEAKPKILEFVQSLKPPVEAPVAPPVEPATAAPVPPPVAPAPPPVAAVEPSVAEDSELVTAAPVVEAAAPKAETPAAPAVEAAAPKVEAPKPELSDFQKKLKDYWGNTATPAIRNYLSAISSFGIDRLEKNQIKPAGMTPREWLESFVSKQSTWDKGRKTGETGIQALSTKNLWPTTDGSGERLRKAMLEAVKALKNAPGSTGDLVSEAFGEKVAAPTVEAAAPTPAAPAESDKKALEEKRQMIADMIETKKANREAVPEAWIKKLADLSAQLRGETIEEDVTYSMEVPGHPLFDGPPVLRNLVPIKVKDSAAAQRALDRALDLEKEVATEFYSARQALSVAKTAAQKKAAQARVKKLNDQGWDEDALKTLRTETIGELSRLVDVTQKAPAAPTVEAAAPKAEAPPTLDTSDIKEVKGRHPQVQAAAKLLQDKKMSREEFEKYVDYYRPIEMVEADKLYPPSSVESMVKAIRGEENKKKINVPIADGTRIGLRMDLPAREKGVPVVSIHEGKPNDDPKTGKPYKSSGKVIGYGSTGYLKDVFFAPRDQEKSLVMGIEPIKEPLQTAEGTWVNLSPEETYARVKELMKDPAWKQIGFDPSRHGYFYDRKTREPVVSASEMYQVGQFLLAKDVEYAPKENFLYSIEPTIKSDRLPSYKRGVENLRKRWDKGEITAEEFANRVDMLARQIESVELAKEFKGRERGADFIRQRLLEAKRRGELSDEAVDFAEWFILRNPALVDDLGISIRTPKEDGVGGMYSEMARVMYLMKERGNDQTIVHEILHHLERMMPKDVQTAIRKNWIKSLMEAQKTAKSDAEKTFFANLTDYHFGNGPRAKLDAAIDAIKNGDVEPSFYQYTSPSEFWAVNGSEIMQGRFDAKGALLQRLKRWLSELKEKARDLFGLNSTAPIIRALDSLSKGDGKFVSKTLLDDVRETRQVIEREGAGKEAGEAKSLGGKRSTQEIARIFGQMVKRAENEMTSVLFNWNDSQLNEDKDKIIMYPGRDQRFVRGKEGGKSNVSKAEFIDWLMSDGPFDTSVYGEEITSDEKWRNEIETLRGIVEQPDIRKSLRDKATDNFRRWFKNSKVVKKGEPLVVYHGTDEEFYAFDPSKQNVRNARMGMGFYFTANKDAAAMSGDRVMPVYLSLQNPYVISLDGDPKFGSEGYETREKLKRDPVAATKELRAAGYDGIQDGNTYVAFEPTQIKSAIGNNGDYSLTNADIRKSIGGRNPGEQAISIVNSLGMGVKPPEPGRFEKAKKMLKDAGENPSLTKESAKKTLTKWLDWFETTVFSSDSAFNNKIRRGIISDFKQNPEVLGMLLEASQSQTVHADALASQFMIDGGLQYNDDLKKWESVKKDDNFVALAKKIEDLAKKYNVTKDEMERIAHTYFVAKRLPGIIKRNEELDAEIKAERATAKPDRKQIEEWESLKVFVSDEQLAMMEPGLSLVKTIPELKEVVDIWQGIRKNNIEVMVNSGLWSPEYATAMWDNMDYVPYYREEQLEEGAGPQEFIRGLQVKSKEFQLKGSGAAVNDVFDNMIRWSQYAMNRAIRAHKATQMIDAALKIEVDGKPMATKVTEEKRGMNIVRAFRDGKQELYDMADPLFVPAFSSIQNVSIPTLTFMSKVSNVLRQSVVLYPLFSVAQVPQDSFAAMFSSGLKTQHALKIPYLAVKEFIKTLSKTSQTHNELKRFGVVGVRDFSATVIRDDAEIYAGLKPPKGGWGKTKEFLEHIAMSADNAVRQAVYEASMQQGLNKSEALEKAFEIINFRRRGTSKMLNVMGQTVPFFYAYLSAQRVAYRVLSGVGISPSDRKEALTTLATTSAAVAALSMLYAMANGDDEDYAETPAAIRDRTLTIPGSGGVRIPLRPDFFLFPKIVAEHTYLMLSDKGYEDGAKFRKSMADALLSAVASPTPFPTAIKPAIEVAINYDFFQGKPLIGNFEKQKDIERQFRDSTSELAKILSNVPLSYSLEKGKFEGLSPIAIDHMIRGMLGSFGGLVLFGTNQFLHSDPDVPRPELSANEMIAALPGTSGLLKRPQESALKNDFYQLRDEVEKAANTFNDIKTRSPEGIQAFLEDEKNMARLGLAKGVDKINRELSKIRKVMTQITNMPESQMSGDEKSENIRQLRELEREILRSVNVKELREMAKI